MKIEPFGFALKIHIGRCNYVKDGEECDILRVLTQIDVASMRIYVVRHTPRMGNSGDTTSGMQFDGTSATYRHFVALCLSVLSVYTGLVCKAVYITHGS